MKKEGGFPGGRALSLVLLVCSLGVNLFLLGRSRTPAPPVDTAGTAETPKTYVTDGQPRIDAGDVPDETAQAEPARAGASPVGRRPGPAALAGRVSDVGPNKVASRIPATAGTTLTRQNGAAPGLEASAPGVVAGHNSGSVAASQNSGVGLPPFGGYGGLPSRNTDSGGNSGTPTQPGTGGPSNPPIADNSGNGTGEPNPGTGSRPGTGGPGSTGTGTSGYEQRVAQAAGIVYDTLVGPNLGEEVTVADAVAKGMAPPKRPTADVALRSWVESEGLRRTWSEELRVMRRTAIAQTRAAKKQ